MTHDTSSSPADSEPCRCGSTTLVTLVSRICMKATTMTVRVMAHFRAGEIGGGSEAGEVTGRGAFARLRPLDVLDESGDVNASEAREPPGHDDGRHCLSRRPVE